MNREHPYDPEIFGTDSREPFRLGIVPGDERTGPLDLPQPMQPILAEVALEDGEPAWQTMNVWLDAGQTPRFVFPNGPKEGRIIWMKVAEYHKDLWPRFMSEGDRKKGKIGIVGAKQLTLSIAKFPHIRIDEVKVRGPISKNGYTTISCGKIFHKHETTTGFDAGQWAFDVWHDELNRGGEKPETVDLLKSPRAKGSIVL
ncbi:hypothetical protein Poly41_65900 [Novipirellula artificiosorum]|uniref:Uncharacterized protein n=1 Tax=Novipirellula artificiosorum TaxID=2528016 RepID=A0A5C6D3J4_9BACT|nr:hypothetical protein Poly41_65900 [Novipirellula artificiosorum]